MPRRPPAKSRRDHDEESVSDHERTQAISDSLQEPAEDNDTTSVGHIMLRNERQHLYYLRLIEHEMPKLVGELPANFIFHISLIDMYYA
jgi:small subunit ribosomal protein S35